VFNHVIRRSVPIASTCMTFYLLGLMIRLI